MIKQLLPYRLTLLIIFFLFTFCSQTEQTISEEVKDSVNVNEQEFKQSSEFRIFNSDKTFVILIPEFNGKENVLFNKKFYVFDQKNYKNILEDFIPQGKVFWITESKIQVEKHPGIISRENDGSKNGYIFDVITLEKTKIP